MDFFSQTNSKIGTEELEANSDNLDQAVSSGAIQIRSALFAIFLTYCKT